MNQETDKTAEKSVNALGYIFKEQKQENGRISHFITQHLKDPRDATFFDTAEEKERDRAVAAYNKSGINFMGEHYTNSATHTLFGLSYLLSMEKGEDIERFKEETQKAPMT